MWVAFPVTTYAGVPGAAAVLVDQLGAHFFEGISDFLCCSFLAAE
jgi:hypothetical protein